MCLWVLLPTSGSSSWMKPRSGPGTVPFFRMPLMPSGLSKQHELLIELEKKYPKTVLSVSPGLRDSRAFNRAYTNGDGHRKSVFFSPGNIGPLPDPKAHSIAYRDGLSYAWLCS